MVSQYRIKHCVNKSLIFILVVAGEVIACIHKFVDFNAQLCKSLKRTKFDSDSDTETVTALTPSWPHGVESAASPWPTLGIRSCRTFCSDLA